MIESLNIGICHGGGLGDNINLTAYASAVKRQFPNSFITVIITTYPEVFRDNKVVDRVIKVDLGFFQKYVNENVKKFDLFLEVRYAGKWHFSEKSLLDPRIQTFKKQWEKTFPKYEYVFNKFLGDIKSMVRMNKTFHEVAFESSALNGDIKDQFISIRPEDFKASEKYNDLRVVTISNGAAGGLQTKSWNLNYWKDTCVYLRKIGFYPIQIGDNKDVPIEGVERFSGTMFETSALIKKASFHMGIENGMAHIANAVGTKSIVLFGATPIHVFGYKDNINLRSNVCSPCFWKSNNWFKWCALRNQVVKPSWTPPCMMGLTPLDVIKKGIMKLLKERGFSMRYLEPSLEMDEASLKTAMWHKERDLCEQAKGTPFEKIELEAFKNILNCSSEEKEINKIVELIGHNKTVLDLSGDEGFLASLLRTKRNDVTVGGFSKIRLLRAKINHKLKTFFFDAIPFEFANEHFDFVILSKHIPYSLSFGNLFVECERVCKKDGKVLMVLNNADNESIEIIRNTASSMISFKNSTAIKKSMGSYSGGGIIRKFISKLNGRKISFGEGLMNKFNHLIVGVPEGIGDIIWVYRKCKPYCDTMSIVINHTNNQTTGFLQELHERSVPVIKSLPGVTDVQHRYGVKPWTHEKLKLQDILNTVPATSSTTQFNYICNSLLENGVYLEDIDKDLNVLWSMNLPLEENPSVKDIRGNYMLVYIAEYTIRHGQDKSLKLWSATEWADFVDKALKTKKIDMPIVLTGANFDKSTQEIVAKRLKELGRTVILSISESPEKLFYTIKNCKYFIGYQSGLNILADELDVKQMMLYFPTLRNMKDSWVKPENRTNGVFNYAYFDDNKDEIIKRMLI